MAKAKASVSMELIGDKQLLAAIAKIDTLVKFKVTDKAVRAGGKPILAQMKQNVPDSRRTNSRDKQSSKTKSEWKGSRPLRTTLKAVYRKRPSGMLALVGPDYSSGGGHGNLFSKDHDRKVLWGNDSGETRRVNRFVKDAADQSRNEVSRIMITTIRTGIDEAAREARSG